MAYYAGLYFRFLLTLYKYHIQPLMASIVLIYPRMSLQRSFLTGLIHHPTNKQTKNNIVKPTFSGFPHVRTLWCKVPSDPWYVVDCAKNSAQPCESTFTFSDQLAPLSVLFHSSGVCWLLTPKYVVLVVDVPSVSFACQTLQPAPATHIGVDPSTEQRFVFEYKL